MSTKLSTRVYDKSEMRIPPENFAGSLARRLDSSRFRSVAIPPPPPEPSRFSLGRARLPLDPGEFLENRRDFVTYFISAHVAATGRRDDRLGDVTRSAAAARVARINYGRAVSSSTVIGRVIEPALGHIRSENVKGKRSLGFFYVVSEDEGASRIHLARMFPTYAYNVNSCALLYGNNNQSGGKTRAISSTEWNEIFDSGARSGALSAQIASLAPDDVMVG